MKHSQYRENSPFFNPYQKEVKRNFFHFLLWRLGYYNHEKNVEKPNDFIYPINLPSYSPDEPSAVWINHSSFYIQVGVISFLTDPIFSPYCSPLPFKALRRKHTPGIGIEKISSLDFVLVSHNHYDHLDEKSVFALQEKFPDVLWVVPLGVKKWFSKRKIERVKELGWWEALSFSSYRITATPTQHFSGRSLWDRDKTLWNGYVVEVDQDKESKKLYFCGDTGYNSHDFVSIGKKWGGVDLSLIPIGAYMPRSFMSPVHVSPSEAVVIHQEVKSRLSVGMHWKTFHLSDEPMDLPPYELYLAMKEKNLHLNSFIPIDPGVYINW